MYKLYLGTVFFGNKTDNERNNTGDGLDIKLIKNASKTE